MTEKLSALMDGELDDAEVPEVIDALASEPELQQAWRGFHDVALALRGRPVIAVDVCERVLAEIARDASGKAASDGPELDLLGDPLEATTQASRKAPLI